MRVYLVCNRRSQQSPFLSILPWYCSLVRWVWNKSTGFHSSPPSLPTCPQETWICPLWSHPPFSPPSTWGTRSDRVRDRIFSKSTFHWLQAWKSSRPCHQFCYKSRHPSIPTWFYCWMSECRPFPSLWTAQWRCPRRTHFSSWKIVIPIISWAVYSYYYREMNY